MAATWMALFFALGAAFGLATFRKRHLFSEGPSTPPEDEASGALARLLWVCIAATLWPVLLLSGIHGAWRRRAARQARPGAVPGPAPGHVPASAARRNPGGP